MKSYVIITTMVVLLIYLDRKWCSAAPTSELVPANPNKVATPIVAKKLKAVWKWLKYKSGDPESLLGRCIGAAKGLKVAMPLIIFKLGVIVTIVTFLTVFSLKALGMLATLLFINLGGAFSKFAFLKHDSDYGQPQNVHYHLHNRHMPLNHYHPGSNYEGWSRRRSSIPLTRNEQIELNNLYNRLELNPNENGYMTYDR